ncbi:MAG: hypothetical protein IK133_00300 [Clostridia bacterium]|nr:hypothetical protein [Clostridia bacterium]
MKHNRLIAFLLVVIMLLCIGAAAETYRVETPNKGTLNLRSVKDNSVIGRIPNGTLLEPDPEKSTETAAYVTYNGKSGYAKWEFLKRVETNDVSELPTGGDGDWFVGAIGAYIQPGLEGDAYGEQFGSYSCDSDQRLMITADKKPAYWVINGVRYDFEFDIPRSFIISGVEEDMTIEAVPKGTLPLTLLSAEDIQEHLTGDTLIAEAIHAKLCYINDKDYGAGGWYDTIDFTKEHKNLSSNKKEPGGQLTARVRATIPKNKTISYWKFDGMMIDFDTNVTQFIVRGLNVSKTYEPVFEGTISKPAETTENNAYNTRPSTNTNSSDSNSYNTRPSTNNNSTNTNSSDSNSYNTRPSTDNNSTNTNSDSNSYNTRPSTNNSTNTRPSNNNGTNTRPSSTTPTPVPNTRPSTTNGTNTRPSNNNGTNTRPSSTTPTPVPNTRPSTTNGTNTRPSNNNSTNTRPSGVTPTPVPNTRPSTTNSTNTRPTATPPHR